MSAEQDTAMYDQPDDAGDERTAADKEFDAEANREAEFWRTHTRDDAWPDDEQTAPTVRDYFPNITEEQLASPGFRAMATAWHDGRPDETAHRDDNDQSQCGCSACEHYELVNARARLVEQAATIAAVMKWRHDWFSEPIEGGFRAAHLRRLDAILDEPAERII